MSENGSPPVALRRPPQPNLRHGVYAARVPLTEEEEAEVESLLALPHVVAADRAAAEELVRMRSLISRVDDYLASGSIVRRGRAPTLVDHRRRLSAQLVVLLEHFGLTPKARAEWVRALAAAGSETLGERISRRLAELEERGL